MSSPYSHIEVKLGMFVAFCLALFVCMLITYGKVTPIWRARREINVVFENVNMLRPDASVRYNGFEVGRVKSVQIIHLDNAHIDRMAGAINRHSLGNLPLRPDALIRNLRAASDEDFLPRCRAALQDRSMIELTLELMQEGDDRRFHVDDQVHIVTTIFGDTAVEIFSGSGAINSPSDPKLILGTSGDFFSNLSKSMGDVKEILSNVTDLVGVEERDSFLAAQARLASTTKRLDSLTALAHRRADASAARLDKLGGDTTSFMGHVDKFIEVVSPHAKRIEHDAKGAVEDIKKRINELQGAQADARKEISSDLKLLQDDVKYVTDKSEPDFEPLQKNMSSVFDSFSGLSKDMENMRNTAGWMYTQSEPEFGRTGIALKNSLVNLQQFGEAAKENKDLVISRKDSGEHDYNTIVDTYRRMGSVSRRVEDALAEVQQVPHLLPDGAVPARILENAAKTEQRLKDLQTPLEEVYGKIEEKMLPKYERKKAAW